MHSESMRRLSHAGVLGGRKLKAVFKSTAGGWDAEPDVGCEHSRVASGILLDLSRVGGELFVWRPKPGALERYLKQLGARPYLVHIESTLSGLDITQPRSRPLQKGC